MIMIDVATLSASEILAIPEDQPERLFGSPDEMAARYRALAMRWHPDRAALRGPCAGADEVFSRIAALHAKGREKLDRGTWRTPGIIEFHGQDGRLRRVRHQRAFDLGIGEGYL